MRASEYVLNGWAWFAGRPGLRKLNNVFLQLGLHGLGVGNLEKLNGEFRMLSKLSLAWRRSGTQVVLFDVGANKGEYSLALRRLCPQARVLAFEAHPITATRVQARLGSTVEVHSLAVGSAPGKATLWDYDHRPGSPHASLLPGVIEELHHSKSLGIEVDVITLDLFCEQRGIGRIDHLKLDVEGVEADCLRGASRLIARGGIGTIQFEFNSMNISSRSFFHDFVELLPGFVFYRLLPHGLMKMPVGDVLRCNFFGIQNILAVSESATAPQTNHR